MEKKLDNNVLLKTELKQKLEELLPMGELLKNHDQGTGWRMAIMNLLSCWDFEEPSVMSNFEPHYTVVDNKKVWITYENGIGKSEPYNHQDGDYNKLCAFHTYCRCTN